MTATPHDLNPNSTQASAIDPNVESQLIDEALVLHQSGDLDSAAQIYRRVLALNPHSFDALNFLGLIEYSNTKYTESLELFKEAIRIYPANPSFYVNTGRALEKLGRERDALSVYKAAIDLDPKQTQAYLDAGLLSQRLSETELAIGYFDQALAIDPALLNAYLSKSALLASMREYNKAIQTIELGLTFIPNTPELYLGLGLLYEEYAENGNGGDHGDHGDHGHHGDTGHASPLELAVQAYTKAASLRDPYASAVFNRANVYQKLAQWELSIQDYQLVIEWDAGFAPAFTNLGLAFYKQSNYPAAIESFQEAIRLDPSHAETYSNLGVVLYESQQFMESLAAYEKAVHYKADYFEAYSNRGNVLKELRHFEAALQSYNQALALREDYFEAYVNRGVVYFELNRLEAAAADYARALKLNPAYALAYSNRANVHKELGQLEQALSDLQAAVGLKLEQLKSSPLDRKVVAQKPMAVQDASGVLLELHTLLQENGIPFFLAYGTLLGIYRDGELLPHDKDLDVGLSWDCDREGLIRVLKQSGRYWIDPKSSNPNTYQFNFGVIELRKGISIDFFFFKPADSYLLSGFHHLPEPLLWQFKHFEWGEIKYKDRVLGAPSDPEQYLVDIYGPQWRIPDPYFDSLVSGYNLTEGSRPISFLYAYSRLFDHLMEQSWKKAYGYCVQIKAFESNKGRPQSAAAKRTLEDLMVLLESLIGVD